MAKKAWKLGKGKYAYVTPRGKRGITDSWKKARKKAGYKAKSRSKSSRSKSKSSRKGGRRKMGMKLKLGATAGLAITGIQALKRAQTGDWDTLSEEMSAGLVGKGESKFVPEIFMSFWGPTIVGAGISLLAAKTGINRYLPKGINL